MNAYELLSEIECLNPAVVARAKARLAARQVRGDRHRWPPSVVSKARELHAQGLGRRRIGKRLGIHPNTVRGMLERAS